MREMHPHLVMATLIPFLKTQRASGDGERTMHPYLPLILGVVQGGTSKFVLAKVSSHALPALQYGL